MPPRSVTGFTFIELVIVIVLIAVLAALALPRLVNIMTQTQTASLKDVAYALSAASANNFAVRSSNTTAGIAVTACTALGPLIPSWPLPDYSIVTAPLTANVSSTCTLNGPGGLTLGFIGTGIT